MNLATNGEDGKGLQLEKSLSLWKDDKLDYVFLSS